MIFVACAPLLEELLKKELEELGIEVLHTGFCGVYLPYSMRNIYLANYGSRIATRVLLSLKKFKITSRQELYEAALSVDWSRYLPKGATLAIDVNGSHPAFKNTLFAAQVVKDAICDQMRERRGMRPSVDIRSPDVQLNLFLSPRESVLSFDTSLTPLFKRGYRQACGPAPLQESMAAALLMLAEYTGQEHFFDPCCGSGTLLIEAGLIATATPPGFLRQKWGFFTLPDFSSQEWNEVKATLDSKRKRLVGTLRGLDRDGKMIQAARINSKAAGVPIIVEKGEFQTFTPTTPINFIVTNPPHGVRMQEDLPALYRALGDFFKQKTEKPAKGYIFTTDLALTKEVGLKASKREVLKSSGLDARLLKFDLY